MAKESVLKKVGGFVANELLGVDDAKRAINKASEGDIKGAIKSAATGALELGTTVSGAGIGAKLGAKVGLKVGEAVAEAGAKRTAQAVGKKVAESTPAGRYGKAGGEAKTMKVEGETTTISKSGAKSTSTDAKKVEFTTPKKTPAQRQGAQKAQDTKREIKIYNAAADSYEGTKEASLAPKAGKAIGKVAGAVAGTTTVTSTKKVENPKGSQAGHAVTDNNNHTRTVK